MLLPTVISAPAKGFQGDLKADGRGDVEVPLADRALVSRESGGVREGGLVRKRPRLIFDRAAAQVIEYIATVCTILQCDFAFTPLLTEIFQ